MTRKFVDYLKQNVGYGLGDSKGKTANQFYEDVLGYSRPRGHNAMFFASIKDSGIVKMERQGRQFVYSLGPNYQEWVEGRLLRR
jgi:predicted transcriptional regulator